MPLTRNAAPLLRTVQGKPHATQHDHYDSLPTPPATNSTRSSGTRKEEDEEAINAEPQSSDEEEQPYQAPASSKTFLVPRSRPDSEKEQKHASFQRPDSAHLSRARQSTGASEFRQARNVALSPEQAKPAEFKQSIAADSPGSIGSKRGSDDDPASSDSDKILFSSQGSNKRFKYSTNLHAKSGGSTAATFKGTSVGYGSKERQRRDRDAQRTAKLKDFERRTAGQKQGAPAPVFKQPKTHDLIVSGSTGEQTQWQNPGDSGDRLARRNSMSSEHSRLTTPPSSPDIEEVQGYNLPPPISYRPTVKCSICEQEVDKFLREEFEDKFEFGPNEQLSYKWQQRFCTHHKRHEGEALWRERKYPEIDWERLHKRLRWHDAHIRAAIDGIKPSYFRTELSERLKQRAKAQLNEKMRERSKTGYYGPRGEKIMAEYIVANHSETLRRQATNDRLVAASGISGGVSGFVQAVLVPELAQRLVMEDMGGVSEEVARERIAESAEIGELIHPEAEERVTEGAEVE